MHIEKPDKKNQNLDHWSVASTVNYENSTSNVTCSYYDSAYTTLPFDTDEVIAQLLTASSKCFKITVNIMSIGKQTGSTDCGLYAVAIATSIAYNIDPGTIIF